MTWEPELEARRSKAPSNVGTRKELAQVQAVWFRPTVETHEFYGI
jgi:hypothetical protein